MPGRAPCGGVFCRRGAPYVTCSSTFLKTVAVCCPREEWCVASATAIATAIRSCRSIERRRRSRRLIAAPMTRLAMADRWRRKKLGWLWWWWWCGPCVHGKSLSMNHDNATNSGGRTPGSKLPASPPPLLRPDGGGQPWPCTCVHGPKKTPHELIIAMMS